MADPIERSPAQPGAASSEVFSEVEEEAHDFLAAQPTVITGPPTPDTRGEYEAPTASGESASPDADLPVGARVGGRYRIERVIGRGAMGVVYEASHEVLHTRVALKCVHPRLTAQEDARERFLREARLAASVHHPNVVRVLDGGMEGEHCFLAMELLEGESLTARLERGPLSLSEVRALFLPLLDGVTAVHAKDAVHRDLKPDNVFLRRSEDGGERPVILDFGISKLRQVSARPLTTVGTLLGSPLYMAPEQFHDTRNADPRADVYAVGAMLYEALTGRTPAIGNNVLDIYRNVTAGLRPPLKAYREDVPAALEDVLGHALEPLRDSRLDHAEAFRTALDAALSPDATSVRRTRPSLAPTADLAMVPTRVGRGVHGEVTKPTSSLALELAPAGPPPSPAPFWIGIAAAAVAGALATGSLVALAWTLLR